MGLGGDPGGSIAPSLDGRSFTAASVDGPGQVDGHTVFHYHEDAGAIWADYAGGDVVRGNLVGTRSGEALAFRYAHLDRHGDTATGRCETEITVGGDGLLRLAETWHWESKAGSGISILVELP